MDKDVFAAHFEQAWQFAIAYSRTLVEQNLPESVRFLLHLNQSHDGNPLEDDEEIFPEDRMSSLQEPEPVTDEQVIAKLWRNAKVPEWVNVSVVSEDSTFTYVELLCCGRYTAKDEQLYHRAEGYPPFHVLSPPLPPTW